MDWHLAGTQGNRHFNADAAASGTIGDTVVLALADGIGDTPAAALAARVATAAAVEVGLSPREGLLAAQRAVRSLTDGDCVLVIAHATPTGYRIAWVGDARAYTWNGTAVRQLTTDHTIAQYFATRGVAVAPRLNNIVTTSVRTAPPATIGEVDSYLPTALLLTTDGVHKGLTSDRIASLLSHSPAPATTLVTAARGDDNATAIVVGRPETHPHHHLAAA
ncbi:PP2C family protein-serine/threonine phosphatase [Actinokineospora globicatena]|uniref:PP2C family protein-serine/threonine phosphatase n=1 Tax=Actinokineospora globicatena TaxID=103729 RepID=UPI0020A5D2DD|nr:serine/threonine protein phosphatase [Actinokineospora globicatena]MCP2306243.1 protein phosphatase [Actinokineospora globicatena]GLW81669.1 serine/threonine protein phosphatase [Actinokineospora globicatena]GLW88463.1 serine/threonine protein phosphatase [Actinokineospora globicatena]